MQLVLQANRRAPTQSSRQKHKAPKLTSMLNNKAIQAKLESTNYLATQSKQLWLTRLLKPN
jgi:hypothetical protein